MHPAFEHFALETRQRAYDLWCKSPLPVPDSAVEAVYIGKFRRLPEHYGVYAGCYFCPIGACNVAEFGPYVTLEDLTPEAWGDIPNSWSYFIQDWDAGRITALAEAMGVD